MRISPVVSSGDRQAGTKLVCPGWCLYQCFVCEFVVSFDRIIPHPREEGELLLSTVKVQPRSPGTASSSSSCPRHVVEVKGGEVCGSLSVSQHHNYKVKHSVSQAEGKVRNHQLSEDVSPVVSERTAQYLYPISITLPPPPPPPAALHMNIHHLPVWTNSCWVDGN